MKWPAWLRHLIMGPTVQEISDMSVSLGGPRYPVPPISTKPPEFTPLHSVDWIADPEPPACTCGGISRHFYPCPLSETAQALDERAARPARTRTFTSVPITPDTPGEEMSDESRPTAKTERVGEMLPADPYDSMKGGVSDADEWAATPKTPDPVTDSGVHHLDEPDARGLVTLTVDCLACKGTGHVTRTVNDLLRETVGMIPVDGGDQVIREFYRRLLAYVITDEDDNVVDRVGQRLAPLFPRDLLTAAVDDSASPGALQRDRLLGALVSVSELYGGNDEDMERLNDWIGSWGNAHSAFARPDGSVEGATEAEYDVVINVFLGLLRDALTDSGYTPAHEQAWRLALRHVKIGMLWTQLNSGMRMARYPRRDAQHG